MQFSLYREIMFSIYCILIKMIISVFTEVGLGFFDFVLTFVASDPFLCDSDSEVFCESSDVIFGWRCTGHNCLNLALTSSNAMCP